MTALQTIEQIGNDAVKKLRLQKLQNGRPFMINSGDLAPDQCYLEFPDGHIQLVYLKNSARDFTTIRTLSLQEEQALRLRLPFFPFIVMPELYIITGSNGAGKSSIGPEYLPDSIRRQGHVFDGDKLFVEKRKELWRTIKSHKECRNLAFEFVIQTFDNLVETALSQNSDFAYEGHFSNEATWDIPRRFRAAGYAIHLLFFGLRDTDLSQLRVIDRTNEGGHYVDPQTVEANFYGNLEKLDQHYGLFQTVRIIDTSEAEHRVLVVLNQASPVLAIPTQELPDWFRNKLPAITSKVLDMESGSFT